MSRTLSSAEKNYSQLEKEGLAWMFGVKRFHSHLFGRSFLLYTDHKPLVGLLAEKKAIPAHAWAWIQRWALTMSMYQYQLHFRSFSADANADALSYLPLHKTCQNTPLMAELVLFTETVWDMPVSVDQIKTWTRKDPTLSRVMDQVFSERSDGVSNPLIPYYHKRLELQVQDHCPLSLVG